MQGRNRAIAAHRAQQSGKYMSLTHPMQHLPEVLFRYSIPMLHGLASEHPAHPWTAKETRHQQKQQGKQKENNAERTRYLAVVP